MEPFENRIRATGVEPVAGIDEAGRGALFGPVVAAAVVLSPDRAYDGVDDSKVLTPARRRSCFVMLAREATDWSVGVASASEIDRHNVVGATRRAMVRAVRGLRRAPRHLLIDALELPELDVEQTAIVRGDRRCLSIAAASVVAKVTRDTLMSAYARRLPGYGLGRNMGYGTVEHRAALAELGRTSLHRRTFANQHELPFHDDRRHDDR